MGRKVGSVFTHARYAGTGEIGVQERPVSRYLRMVRSALLTALVVLALLSVRYQRDITAFYKGIHHAVTEEYMMVEWDSKDERTCGITHWTWTRRADQTLADFLAEVAELQAAYPSYTAP